MHPLIYLAGMAVLASVLAVYACYVGRFTKPSRRYSRTGVYLP